MVTRRTLTPQSTVRQVFETFNVFQRQAAYLAIGTALVRREEVYPKNYDTFSIIQKKAFQYILDKAVNKGRSLAEVVTAKARPVVVQAILWDGSQSEAGAIIEWVESYGGKAAYKEANESPDHKPRIQVHTLDSIAVLHSGDWMMKGTRDEFYPNKPDVFDAKYDRL